ncbi:Transcription factor [Dispira parvispora]|uniref:Transcription factor n=1 Tax=Dispira parvispora TaxID=1520584 RepID=A0A9W8B0E7_9FUNG|nr:Transcription factor [Dispira parvispora]
MDSASLNELFSNEELQSVYAALDDFDSSFSTAESTALLGAVQPPAGLVPPPGANHQFSTTSGASHSKVDVWSPTVRRDTHGTPTLQSETNHKSWDGDTAELPVDTSISGATMKSRSKAQGAVNSGAARMSAVRRKELLTEEEKKANHIHSEQKRRQNIKVGLDELCVLVPKLVELKKVETKARQESARISSKLVLGEAKILQETLEYTRALHQELALLNSQLDTPQQTLK